MASGSGVAKAWCSITVAGALEAPDYGVASVDDTATGDRTVNFTTNFSTTVYAVTGAVHGGVSDGSTFEYNSRAVDDVQIVTYNGSNTNVDVGGSVAFFGEL
jgi:CO dehydrogenase/acetyl-CoA synthase gamma subunit (corrinoid Fe-S protein)